MDQKLKTIRDKCDMVHELINRVHQCASASSDLGDGYSVRIGWGLFPLPGGLGEMDTKISLSLYGPHGSFCMPIEKAVKVVAWFDDWNTPVETTGPDGPPRAVRFKEPISG